MTIRIDGTNTAANPGITGTDTDTGLQFGTDEVNIVTGGSTRATVDSSGEFGIGTTTPDATLHVYKAGDGQTPVHFQTGNSNGHLYFYNDSDGYSIDSGGNLRFVTGRTGSGAPERMQLDTSGNLKFNSGFGSVATAYGCRAWVNFNASGTLSIRGSGNISSVTDNGVGQFAPNFTNAMPDTNYAGVCSHNAISGGNDGAQASPNTTSAASVQTGSAGAWRDPSVVCVAFFR